MSTNAPKVDGVLADRAEAMLRSYERERLANPSWRATTLDRCIARGLDALLIIGLAAIVLIAFLSAGLLSDRERTPAVDPSDQDPSSSLLPESVRLGPTMPSIKGLLVIAGSTAVLVTYELGTTAVAGATPGKRMLGLRVVRSGDRTAPGMARLALRTTLWTAPIAIMLAMWFTSILLAWLAVAVIAGFVWPAFSSRADGNPLYDRLAATTVAKRQTGFD